MYLLCLYSFFLSICFTQECKLFISEEYKLSGSRHDLPRCFFFSAVAELLELSLSLSLLLSLSRSPLIQDLFCLSRVHTVLAAYRWFCDMESECTRPCRCLDLVMESLCFDVRSFQNILGGFRSWFWHFWSFDFCPNTPEGRPGMSDVSPLSGISGLSFDSTLLSPLLFCYSFCPFFFFVSWSILLNFFPKKFFNIFR